MHLGMIGLGRMGLNMTRRLMQGGQKVTVYNRTSAKVREAEKDGAIGSASIKELCESLPAPKIVWLMVPAGEVTDRMIEEVKGHLSEGDIIIDGGNTYYKDDIRRSAELGKDGIHYMDVGTSGGIWGLKIGYCLMIGGEQEVFDQLEPIFAALAPAEGYMYCGPSGGGHFIKMVHNGIEYGMMEAYAEGFELVDASPYGKGVDFSKVSHLWNQGSVIRSWLLELLEDAFKADERLESITGYVEDSGEGRWAVKEAVDMGVNLPVITESLFRRFRSRKDDSFGEKVLAALRNQFGGHAVKKAD